MEDKIQTKLKDVIEFFENKSDIIEVSYGMKPLEFLKHLSDDDLMDVIYLLRLRWLITQPQDEEQEE